MTTKRQTIKLRNKETANYKYFHVRDQM